MAVPHDEEAIGPRTETAPLLGEHATNSVIGEMALDRKYIHTQSNS